MYQIAALLYPRALATSITLPLEILHAAGQIARVKSRLSPGVRHTLAAATGAPVTLFGGLTLSPDSSYRELPALDLLIIPAIWRNPAAAINSTRKWLPELARIAASGTRVCAVGTGTCLLAEAGLLDGKPATTHWNYLERFARDYPGVQLKSRHLITQSDNIYCVGSVNSIADLMVHVVEDWYGSGVARAVENQFSPEIRRPFRAAAFQTEGVQSHHDETVLEAQQWFQDRLAGRPTVQAAASELGISARTLNRRFRQATGLSPQAWLQRLRVQQARELLRHSNLSLAEVAWQVGLQDVSHFGKLFREQVGMTPGAYREAVRGKLFATERA
ncbi:helix-turn-helix domain-containing protein [Seongchinamella sediminis]|uniref:Helix-turn-helix domain-containing protein n=1 Tax=Seongchinamella sediminis TaxID=2283635 RepID=A0A3L7E3R9_9GAMM|nr:helix-turn-helix domain-containing protein [Seongchinamella sediminis]RLQ23133.1 helix-turn-helix domain-containing protein [Seongchinamella sediminis]